MTLTDEQIEQLRRRIKSGRETGTTYQQMDALCDMALRSLSVPAEGREYRVTIELMRDKVAPSCWALSFANENGGYRITDGKATGSWDVVRTFRCSFSQSELDQYDKPAPKP